MRKITDKMFKYIDKKLEKNGAAQLAVQKKDARSLLVYASEACVGIEEAGNNKGTWVVELQKTVDNKAEQEPYCMGGVQTWITYVEKKLNITSPIFSSEHCLTTWEKSPKSQRVKSIPLAGAIIIWQHGKSRAGHTGIVTEWLDKKMETVEANTSGKDTINGVTREGSGVFQLIRSSTGSGSMKVVGFLKPF